MKFENSLEVKIEKIAHLLDERPGYCVLTGAGCSTASGLPAYRNTNGDWQHDKPMEHRDFIDSEFNRKIYWARSQRGWPRFRAAKPNKTHTLLACLQHSGHVRQIVTQNVDRLHQVAGSNSVIDLHGRLDQVICLDCKKTASRDLFQQRLDSDNSFNIGAQGQIRPDGDVAFDTIKLNNFSVPECEHCQGILKPHVVFFGGVLDPQIAAAAITAVEQAPGLLVVGSSLMVYSGFRLVKRAIALNKPVLIINQGKTRADDLYTLKIEHESGQVLRQVNIALRSG